MKMHMSSKDHFNTSPPALPTITAVNQRFNKTGSVEGSPRTGRPATVLTEVRHGGYQSTIIDSTRLVSGTSRDHTAMQKLQLKLYHPTLIVDLNKDDFDRCSQSSEIYLEKFNYDPALVDHILWIDECKFNRNRTVNRHNCTYCFTENPRARFSVPNTEEGIMVWCDLSSNGLLDPYFFNETVTDSTYR